ncbi:hypothetical protein EOL70_14125 [Leucothrix sargassi]|nr:hypothetical protein EOL70_14125 [Leucothrix sargassi]
MPADYNIMDATLEILLMLLAAFLLGWLFCWILKKIFGRKAETVEVADLNSDLSTDINKQAAQGLGRTGLSADAREKLYDPEHGLTRDDIDTSIPTVETTVDTDVNIDTTTSRPRIDIPDLNMPEPDLSGKLEAGKESVKSGLGAAALGLGGIAAGAAALKEKAVDGVSSIDTPDLDLKDKLDAGIDAGKDGLSSIADGATSLKDKALDSVSGIEAPDLDLEGKLDAGIEAGKDGLSGITDGAASLKDKALDSVSGIEAPDLDLEGKLDAGIEAGKDGLSDITDGAVSLKDKALDSVSGIETPDLDLKGKLDTGIDAGKDTLAGLGDSAASLKDKALNGVTDLDMPELGIKEKLTAGVDAGKESLSGITDSAASLKDKALDSVSGIDTPDLDLKGKLDAGVESGKGVIGKGLGAATAGLGAIAAGAGALKMKNSDTDLTPPDLPRTKESGDLAELAKSKLSGSKDDLTRITGINTDVAELLAAHDVKTFSDLENTDSNVLNGYLAKSDQVSIRELETTSWPHQAKLCATKSWDKLSEYQTFLTGGTSSVSTPEIQSATEQETAKDDLKKIEGIGPFFESLLNKAGITTYAQLKDSDRDTLKEIIDAAGPDYRLHEPETWPYQAGLADRGEWKKLQDYIHFMTGRSS